MLLACIAVLPIVVSGNSAVSAPPQVEERRLHEDWPEALTNLPEHQVDALYPKPGEKSPVYKFNPATVYKVGVKNYLEGPKYPMLKKESNKCKPYCKLFVRRDQACDKHYMACGGCPVCKYSGAGFVEWSKQCPAWCAKYGDGCTKMAACQGCSDCNWFNRVTKSAEKVQGKIMAKPTWAVETLSEWPCKPWCYASEKYSPSHTLPKNMCTYDHCLGCPACEIDGEVRRLELVEENATTVEVPSVFV